MRILVDMDNTICDSVKAIVDCINKEYDENFKANYNCTWDLMVVYQNGIYLEH